MKLAVLALLAALVASPAGAMKSLAGANLLPNGSFDGSVSGWVGYNGTLALDNGAARVTATASGTISIYPSPRPVRSTTKGVSYAATASVKGAAGRTLCLQVREWTTSVAGSHEACVTATGAWQPVGPVSYTTVASGGSLEAYVYERAGVKGDVYRVDDVVLEDASAPVDPPATTTTPPPPGIDVTPATIVEALANAAPGQTLYLRTGTYPAWMTAGRSGTAEQPIVIAAYPGDTPVITGRLKVTGSWTTLKGIHFVGSTAANTNGVLLYVSGADHVSVLANELDHANMSAMYLGDVGNGSDDVTIAGNYIHDNGTHTNLDHGIYMGTGARATIVNNVIARSFARGIQCYPDCDDALIANNTVVANGRAGIQIGNESVSTSDDNLVVNNVVVRNGNTGIRSYWGGTQGTGNVARNNLLWANSGGDTAGPGIAFSGNLVADPLFASSTDFHLRAGSPAIGAALPEYAPLTNFDGLARGAMPNLGAF